MDSGTSTVSNLHRLKAASTAEVVDELDDDLLHRGVAKYHSWSTLVVLDLSEGTSCTCVRKTTVIHEMSVDFHSLSHPGSFPDWFPDLIDHVLPAGLGFLLKTFTFFTLKLSFFFLAVPELFGARRRRKRGFLS